MDISLNNEPESGDFAIKEELFDNVEEETNDFRKNLKSMVMSRRYTELE